jgi:hypothetical protein
MARPTGGKPWGEPELQELAAIAPHDDAAMAQFCQKHGRTHNAACSKLATLRIRRRAPERQYARAAHLASGTSPYAYAPDRPLAAKRAVPVSDPPQNPVQAEHHVPEVAPRSQRPIAHPTREFGCGFDDGSFAHAMNAAIAAGLETALQGAVKEPCTVRPRLIRPHRDVARSDDLAGRGT